jgi:uncharacterized integral membrane protein
MKKKLNKIIDILLACVLIILIVSYVGIITVGYIEGVYNIWHVIGICTFAVLTALLGIANAIAIIWEWKDGRKE